MRGLARVGVCVGILIIHLCLAIAGASEAPTSSPVSAALNHTLAQDSALPEIRFQGVPLDKAVQFLRDASNTNIFMDWPTLSGIGVNPKTPASLNLNNVRTSQVIDALVGGVAPEGKPLEWTVNDEQVICISTAQGVQKLIARQEIVRKMKKDQPDTAKKIPEIRVEGSSFADAIDFLRDVSEANIFVEWLKLKPAGIGPKTPVSLRLGNVSTACAIDLLTTSASNEHVNYPCI